VGYITSFSSFVLRQSVLIILLFPSSFDESTTFGLVGIITTGKGTTQTHRAQTNKTNKLLWRWDTYHRFQDTWMDVVWKHRQQQTGEEFIEAAKSDNRDKLQLLLDTCTSTIPDLVNYSDIQGLTALHYACKVGDLLLCEFLLRNGADATAKSRVRKISHPPMVSISIHHPYRWFHWKEGDTPLHLLHAYPTSNPSVPINPDHYFKVAYFHFTRLKKNAIKLWMLCL